MLKKLIFFSFAIIIGIVVAIAGYFTVSYNYIYDLIDDARSENDYTTVTKVFAPFFDENPVVTKDAGTDAYKFFMYESTTVFYKTVDKTTTNYFSNSFSFLLMNLKELELMDVKVGDTTKNDTSLVFGNGTESFMYKFVDKENNLNLVAGLKGNDFIQINLEKKDFSILNNHITNIRFVDANGNSVFDIACDIDFESDFYTKTSALVNKYDECTANKDPETFNKFYDEWIKDYEASKYLVGYTSKELRPTSVYVKTGGIIAAYIFVMGVLGYFILRKK